MRAREDLRRSQQALVAEIADAPSGIAVLGMGGGKTAAWLTAFSEMQKQNIIDRGLVLAPARVVDNVWPNEPSKWEHLRHLDVVAVVGTPARRKKLLQEEHDVYVVSIDNVQWMIDYFRNSPVWQRRASRTALAIDEISKFKSPRSKRAQKLRNWADNFDGVWGLTGTPRPNSIEDLFNPIKIVGGLDAWGIRDFDLWRREHFKSLDYQGYKWEPHDFALPGLNRIAQEWLVHVETDIVGLPTLNTGDDFVKRVLLTEAQRKAYDTMLEELIAWARRQEDGEAALVQAMSQGAASMKLTQITQGFMYGEGKEVFPFDENPKLDELSEMSSSLGGDRAVIVYGFREEINQLEKLFSDRRVGLLGGGVSTKKANETIDAWNRGEIDRLLLHPASAGHGIELQFGGHHMIHYHPTWSSEMYDQVIKRLHRPGQTHDVFSWWIGAEDTVDDIKYARVESKLADEEAFRQTLRRLR